MKTKLKQLFLAMSVMAVVALAPAIVIADPVSFDLPDSIVVSAGGSATMFGTITNLGPPRVWLTSWTFTLDAGITSDDAAMETNLPFFLDDGESFSGAFFDLLADAGLAPGTYAGSLAIFGGPNEGDEVVDFNQAFSITVTGGQQPIPEPATMLLLGTGLVGAAMARRRKRRQTPTL